MGVDAYLPNDDYRVDTMGQMAPITELRPDGSWQGSFNAFGKSVAGGAAAVGRVLNDVAGTIGQADIQGNMGVAGALDTKSFDAAFDAQPQPIPEWTESLKRAQEWAKLDPRVTGASAQVLGSFTHGITVFGAGSLIGGPAAGAATLGTTEGYNQYQDLKAAGVDDSTAAKMALTTGGFATAGAFLPFKFGGAGVTGGLASVLGGAAINTGFGVAQRTTANAILEHAGYAEMAKQYEPLARENLVADAVLGAAFGGWAHFNEAGFSNRDRTPAERPPEHLVEDALEVRRQEMIARGAAGLPADHVTSALDAELQDRALGDLLRGKDVSVTPEEAQRIVDGSVIDTQRTQLFDDVMAAAHDIHGDMMEPATEVRVEQKPAPMVEPEVATPRPPPVEGETGIDPLAREQMRQIAIRNPDMEVELPSGRVVKASELEQAMQAEMQKANSEAKLHDVAVACFLRTML